MADLLLDDQLQFGAVGCYSTQAYTGQKSYKRNTLINNLIGLFIFSTFFDSLKLWSSPIFRIPGYVYISQNDHRAIKSIVDKYTGFTNVYILLSIPWLIYIYILSYIIIYYRSIVYIPHVFCCEFPSRCRRDCPPGCCKVGCWIDVSPGPRRNSTWAAAGEVMIRDIHFILPFNISPVDHMSSIFLDS